MRRPLQVLLAVVAAVLIAAPVAAAKHTIPSGSAVLADCNAHGALTRQYTHKQLSQALALMPTWMKQYTSCQTVVQTALANGKLHGNGGGGTGGGSGGSSISTPVIIVIVVVALAIVAFAGLLIRRRRRLVGRGSAADAPTQVIEPDRRAAGRADGGGDSGPAP
jgi:hypothetical protein